MDKMVKKEPLVSRVLKDYRVHLVLREILAIEEQGYCSFLSVCLSVCLFACVCLSV